MHYDKEWEEQYGQYDGTQEASVARKRMMKELSVEQKMNIMFKDFLWSKENYQVIGLAEYYFREDQEDTIEESN